VTTIKPAAEVRVGDTITDAEGDLVQVAAVRTATGPRATYTILTYTDGCEEALYADSPVPVHLEGIQ
jgi:predicted SnoaL-like aldol condensation-catalyzing enzyme